MNNKKIWIFSLYTLVFLNLFFFTALISYQITVSGEKVSVPDLVGKNVDEAKKKLAEKKLTLVQSGVRLHERWEQGKVISQDPPSDSKVKINHQIKVILSAGKEKVSVPNLVGEKLQKVNSILDESGLKQGKISQVHSPRYPAGEIIAQHPSALEEVGKNTRVSLLVSQGEREKTYLMPDLIGKKAEHVIMRLKEMEFSVGNLRYSYYPGLQSGVIINQSPSPGSQIQKQSLITLEVSK